MPSRFEILHCHQQSDVQILTSLSNRNVQPLLTGDRVDSGILRHSIQQLSSVYTGIGQLSLSIFFCGLYWFTDRLWLKASERQFCNTAWTWDAIRQHAINEGRYQNIHNMYCLYRVILHRWMWRHCDDQRINSCSQAVMHPSACMRKAKHVGLPSP